MLFIFFEIIICLKISHSLFTFCSLL